MSAGSNPLAILFFFVFIALTLVVTYWAARRTKTTEHFYAAGHGVTGFQNGLALAGDYMSAASFLGIAGLVALNGFDGLIYSTGWLVGWPSRCAISANTRSATWSPTGCSSGRSGLRR